MPTAASRIRGLADRTPRRLKGLVVVAVLGTAAVAVAAKAPSIGQTLHEFGHPEPGLLALAVVAQVLSLRAYTEMVGRLLARAGCHVRQRPLERMTLGGVALTASVPGGAAASVAYWYRQLRAEGADAGTTLYALAGAAVAGAVTLAGLIMVGLVLAGGDRPLQVQLPVLAALALLAAVVVVARKRVAVSLRRCTARFVGESRQTVVPFRASWMAILAFALANWLLDLATLYLSVQAVGADVPLSGLLLVYGLGQVVQSLPLLPGGGGTVEAGLALGFAAFGHTTGSVVAGVLLYRTINTWGLVPLGWAAILANARRFLVRPARFA